MSTPDPRPGSYWPDLTVPRECRRDIRMGGTPKKSYASEAEALPEVGPGENAYKCAHCGRWHVGHKRGGGRLRPGKARHAEH